jgi:hypothetical protein
MPITATYDAEAQALYARITDGQVASSVEVDHEFVVDQDAEGNVLGVEALSLPVRREQVAALAERFGFVARLDGVWSEIRQAQPAVPTRSGTTACYTVTFQTPTLAPFVVGVSSASVAVDSHDYALAS